MRTGSLERAYQLALELLSQTSATLRANFRSITPLITKIDGRYHGSIDFEFWDSEKNEIFSTLIGTVFFPEKEFLKKQTETRTLYIAKNGGQILSQTVQIRKLLHQVNMTTAGNEVGLLLLKNGDRRFILFHRAREYPEFIAVKSNFLNQYMNPSFVVTRDKLYQVIYSPNNERSELSLFDASSIFRFVGEAS
jgi:hypothetical protein